ncbi:MAG: hypothetical protein CL687_04405 [Candidatus Pelagibacter sp.]|nr:hypothetical protein [Candidatus Pelagibacter sp.]OUW23484.1 MAG: hypothetical protein CBD34_02800 [Rickettsiales bacterium TMED174]
MKRSLCILGSTGSIGKSSLYLINKYKSLFDVQILMANSNFKLICEQIKKYKPEYYIINDYNIYLQVKDKFKNNKIKIINTITELKLRKKIDIVISSITGIAGLKPTLYMIKFTKKILLANKESIICGWKLIEKELKKNKTKIVPIDSEHYSLKILLENNPEDIEKIYITASGGPFLNKKIKKVSIKDAIKHPRWTMGKKISVDSATMINKVLELQEARILFSNVKNKIDIIIHPESLVHAIILYKNGLSNMLYHQPDMKIPLANAVFNRRVVINKIFKKKNKKNFIEGKFNFLKINKYNFPSIKFMKLIDEYPSSPIILNAGNEILVDLFLKKVIQFKSIIAYLSSLLRDKNYKKYAIKKPQNIKEILIIDNWARKKIIEKVNIK